MTTSSLHSAPTTNNQASAPSGLRLRTDSPGEQQRSGQQPAPLHHNNAQLIFSDIDAPRLTHYLFRFPAKFHPPVAHSLIRSYTVPGQTVLDPFCGSGTLLVAAAAEDRCAIGSDVDPVAVFVSRAKTHRFNSDKLEASWSRLQLSIQAQARSEDEYRTRQYEDLTTIEYDKQLTLEHLWVPMIPNLQHWFRRYVIVDLARILLTIQQASIPETHRMLFLLVFASILRKSSNADPVPVSGLEVTSYMKKLDEAGRVINPINLFIEAGRKALIAVKSYHEATNQQRVTVIEADATSLAKRIRTQVDAVITSPPYHNAVDYYRRHKLEMFWLGFTKTHADRLDLLPRYIGRPNVSHNHPLLKQVEQLGPLSTTLYRSIAALSRKRADAFAHYMLSMQATFRQLATVVPVGAPVVFVLGHSEWNGSTIPTSDLFAEIGADHYELLNKLWYPLKNRYMSYGRHNGANIDKEHVLVFCRRA